MWSEYWLSLRKVILTKYLHKKRCSRNENTLQTSSGYRTLPLRPLNPIIGKINVDTNRSQIVKLIRYGVQQFFKRGDRINTARVNIFPTRPEI